MSPCARPNRVPVPLRVRQAVAGFTKAGAIRGLGISGPVYDEVIGPCGFLQPKILSKIEAGLVKMKRLDP
jgi:hypothetical protein